MALQSLLQQLGRNKQAKDEIVTAERAWKRGAMTSPRAPL